MGKRTMFWGCIRTATDSRPSRGGPYRLASISFPRSNRLG